MLTLNHPPVLTVLLIFILSAACSNLPETPVYTLSLTQMAAPLHLANTEFQQKITVNVNNKQHSFLVAGKITPQSIRLVALTATGIPLFTIEYNQDFIDIQEHLSLPVDIPTSAIIQDLQLAYWPLSSLQSVIQPSWRIEEKIQQRTLYNADTKWITITYSDPDFWRAEVELHNYTEGYQLTITTLLHQKLP